MVGSGSDNVRNPASGACRQGPNFVGRKERKNEKKFKKRKRKEIEKGGKKGEKDRKKAKRRQKILIRI